MSTYLSRFEYLLFNPEDISAIQVEPFNSDQSEVIFLFKNGKTSSVILSQEEKIVMEELRSLFLE